MLFTLNRLHSPWLRTTLLALTAFTTISGIDRVCAADEIAKIVIDKAYAKELVGIYAAEGYTFTNTFLRQNLRLNSEGQEFRYIPLVGNEFRRATLKGAKKSVLEKAVAVATHEFVRDRRLVLHLDKALESFPLHSGKVYRGVMGGGYFAGLKGGDYYMDLSYMSTSTEESIARSFTSRLTEQDAIANELNDWDHRGPILEINAIGKRGHDIKGVNAEESEVLYERETIFRIESVEFWKEDPARLKRVVMTEWHSDDTQEYKKVRQKLINDHNLKILREAYPQSDAKGITSVTQKTHSNGKVQTFFSDAWEEWNKYDKQLARTIRDYENKNRPYDTIKVREKDFSFEEE
jgi:hypothetical protein